MNNSESGLIDRELFHSPVKVISIGIEDFAETLRQQSIPVVELDWKPPAGGDPDLTEILKQMFGAPKEFKAADPADAGKALVDLIDAANAKAIDNMLRSQCKLVDVVPAGQALKMPPYTISHSGPPITWERMSGPQKRAVLGAIQFEGWAADARAAEALVTSGKVKTDSNYRFSAVAPMAGIISPSMPALVVRNETFGNYAYSIFNEGRGNVLWFGVYDAGTLDRLRWIRDTLGPAVRAAIQKAGPLDVFDINALGIQMGDDAHARSTACTAMAMRELVPAMLDAGVSGSSVADIVRFMADNSHFYLPFTMAAAKATADAAHNIPYSTLVTGISRNGVDCIVRVSGLGNRCPIVPASRMSEAVYYTGYSLNDAAGDIGDSAIVELVGLGGMAVAAAPSMAMFVGGSLNTQIAAVRELSTITLASHPKFTLPTMDYERTPLGIDARRATQTRITPFITTGVLHETSDTAGQIGTGIAYIPVEAFDQALVMLAHAWQLPTELPEPANIVQIDPVGSK